MKNTIDLREISRFCINNINRSIKVTMYIIKKSDNENDIALLFMLLKNIEFDLRHFTSVRVRIN